MPTAVIDRPGRDEYAPYYSAYIRAVANSSLVHQLENQCRDLQSRLSGLTEEDARYRYAADKWSIKDVVGHLVDCELIMCFRALCFARGERQPLPGFEQDDYAKTAARDDQSLASLRRQHDAIRNSTLAFFSSLSPAALLRRGVANDCEFSVRALAWVIAGHELHHMRILAERYGLPPARRVSGNPTS